jgi:hypothetical protein
LKLHRQEKFLYICEWEWDVRVVDMEAGVTGNHLPICLGGRGAAPPECCGGPAGYRLRLQRQRLGVAMSDPGLVKTGMAMLAEACPEEPPQTWALLRTVLDGESVRKSGVHRSLERWLTQSPSNA